MNLHPLDLITYIKRIKKVYKNWLEVVLAIICKQKEVKVILKNEIKIRLPLAAIIGIILLTKDKKFNPLLFFLKENKLYYNNNELILDSSESVLLSANGWIKKNNIWINPDLKLKFKEITYSLFEIFHLKDYDYFDVKNREVIDIGANIGDFAIFFAIKGARRIYAFEPSPYFYEIMLSNIKLNRLDDKILPFNVAISDKCGKIKFKERNKIIEVDAYSLKKVLEFVEDPYLLKIDCEGCEFEIILKSEEIKKFEKIIFEYHINLLGHHKNLLIRKLRKDGFKCSEVKKITSRTGIICCEKL